jgi:hypothetical protein
VRFGDRANFAIEVDDVGRRAATVDIWVAGRSMCCDDNTVHIPSFVSLLDVDLRRIQAGEYGAPPVLASTPEGAHRSCEQDDTAAHERCWFMHWGATTDNLSTYLFRFGESLVITTRFWRDHMSEHDRQTVLRAELPQNELEQILVSTIHYMSKSSTHA